VELGSPLESFIATFVEKQSVLKAAYDIGQVYGKTTSILFTHLGFKEIARYVSLLLNPLCKEKVATTVLELRLRTMPYPLA
jgi:hypothetical protein